MNRKVYELAKSERAKGKEVSFYILGSKGIRFFTAKGEPLFKSILAVERHKKQELAKEITRELDELFVGQKFDEIILAYNGFINRSSYVSRIQPYLPVAFNQQVIAAETSEAKGFYAFEPSSEGVLAVLFPMFLESKIFRSLVESKTAEEAARMLAMDYATENASEIVSELTLLYNRVRQSGITKEISEIVGGAEALK
ncbi:MAG: F0F1 ATP synthase subunit gamma [Candidatus Omnitrophica bacterium]|nr:F0F1 ATP synthase subunit gamma [Candidatus Omnitrophota bacterium]